MGDGPDREQLQALAWPTITFLWSRDHAEKYEILSKARGLINLTKESCGIVTMEALTLWVPVFGYNAGGTAELVTHGKNGRLVDSKDHQGLMEEFENFQQVKFARVKTTTS
jgi:glycosyltransferase involved in cell wall biosynthesis